MRAYAEIARRGRAGERLPIQPKPEPPLRSCGCRPSRCCTFAVPRVRSYLIIWRQACIAGAPFANVLRSESRSSRDVDPWTRGGRVDPDRGRLIGLALERARDVGGLELQPWNAEAVARFCCPFGVADEAPAWPVHRRIGGAT